MGTGFTAAPHSRAPFRPELRDARGAGGREFDVRCPHGKAAGSLPFKEHQPLTPTNSYGLSKEAIERLSLRLGKTYGIPTTLLRYSIVQGPRQSPLNLYSGALRIFVTQALAGKPITVYEDGRQKRDFVNIADVVAANLAVLRESRSGVPDLQRGRREVLYGPALCAGGQEDLELAFADRDRWASAAPTPATPYRTPGN